MFNLEHAIAEWRRQMLAAGIKTPVPLEELESHLREDVEQKVRSGVSAQQAFDAAVLQVGHAGTLKHEFGKIGSDKFAQEQKWMRIYCATFPIPYSLIGTYGLLRIEMSALERLLGFVALVLTCLFIWSTHQYHKFLPTILDNKRRLRIQIAGVLSWMVFGGVFMNFILPHLDFTQGQIVVAVLWLMTPIAAISGIVYGLGEAAHRRFPAAAA